MSASEVDTPRSKRVRARSPAATLRSENKRRFTALVADNVSSSCPQFQSKQIVLHSGRFDEIDDECVSMVMHSLVCLEDRRGVELTMSIQKQARVLANLLLSCTRMFTIYRTIAPKLRREMTARAMSHIRPRDLHAPYPFTTQVEEQARSARMLRVLKEAINGMALHCADECCARSRKVVCRDLKKINQTVDLQPLERRTTLLAAGENSDGAFVCCKRRVPKKTLRHSSSHEMISFLPNKGFDRVTRFFVAVHEREGPLRYVGAVSSSSLRRQSAQRQGRRLVSADLRRSGEGVLQSVQ